MNKQIKKDIVLTVIAIIIASFVAFCWADNISVEAAAVQPKAVLTVKPVRTVTDSKSVSDTGTVVIKHTEKLVWDKGHDRTTTTTETESTKQTKRETIIKEKLKGKVTTIKCVMTLNHKTGVRTVTSTTSTTSAP